MYRPAVVTPEYTAPELMGAEPARVDRTAASDVFALAVLVHQLLLGGAHPFEGQPGAGLGAGSVERVPGRIRRGLCPLVPGVTAVRPAQGALPFATLPAALRALFVRCFGAGHATPEERPAAAEWRKALVAASEAMVPCARNEAHLHDRALARCPFCERRERSGIDLFPTGQGWQRRVARLRDPGAASEADRARWLGAHVRGRLAAGTVTAAERAWLEKAGAVLGFDRARVAQAIEQEASRGALRARPAAPIAALAARLPSRRAVVLSVASLSAGSACTAALLLTSQLGAGPRVPQAQYRPACSVAATLAAIGNTQGTGAFLRAAPSTSSDKLPLPDGTVVRLTGRTLTADELAWSEVELAPFGSAPFGRVGWVATRYLVDPGG